MTERVRSLPADDAAPDRGQRAEAEDLSALLRRCAGRDSRALEALYRECSATLLGCLMQILRRRSLAEEVLQDVYLQIWERSGQYDAHRGRPMTWMISIARYRAIDVLRREQAGRLESLVVDGMGDGRGERAAHVVPVPDAGAVRSLQEEEALEICLRQLAPEPRHCIELAFLQGLSHAEVSVIQQAPLGTIKSWIRRGLAALKECIDSCVRHRPS